MPNKLHGRRHQTHLADGEGWTGYADFWDSLQVFVHRDGGTSNENYEQALGIFAKLSERRLKSLTGEEREAFEKNTRWAVRKPE